MKTPPLDPNETVDFERDEPLAVGESLTVQRDPNANAVYVKIAPEAVGKWLRVRFDDRTVGLRYLDDPDEVKNA